MFVTGTSNGVPGDYQPVRGGQKVPHPNENKGYSPSAATKTLEETTRTSNSSPTITSPTTTTTSTTTTTGISTKENLSSKTITRTSTTLKAEKIKNKPNKGGHYDRKKTNQRNSTREDDRGRGPKKEHRQYHLDEEIVTNLINRGNKTTVLCSLDDQIIDSVKGYIPKIQVIANNKFCKGGEFKVAYSSFPPFVYKENNTVKGMIPSKNFILK